VKPHAGLAIHVPSDLERTVLQVGEVKDLVLVDSESLAQHRFRTVEIAFEINLADAPFVDSQVELLLLKSVEDSVGGQVSVLAVGTGDPVRAGQDIGGSQLPPAPATGDPPACQPPESFGIFDDDLAHVVPAFRQRSMRDGSIHMVQVAVQRLLGQNVFWRETLRQRGAAFVALLVDPVDPGGRQEYHDGDDDCSFHCLLLPGGMMPPLSHSYALRFAHIAQVAPGDAPFRFQ
jgi:hypothetical protein